MSNLRPFQIVLLGIFFFLALASLVFLSVYNPKNKSDLNPFGNSVVVWGSLDGDVMDKILRAISEENEYFRVVRYFEIDERIFDDSLVNAIAEGRSPDLIILPSDKLVKQRIKLAPISYNNSKYTQRYIKDTYVDGAEIFARSDGLYAIPFAVDPLVMYWNRDLFSSNALSGAPTTWEIFVAKTVPALTVRDNNRNIIQSAVAFGEYNNIKNAKETILMLAMQSGSQMITESAQGYRVVINERASQGGRAPFDSSLQFYTDFSNPNNALYSWNRSQKHDIDAFLGGDLAIYFGFGSEASNINLKNPNLNFDIAPVPQGQIATIKRTYGKFYGFAVPRASQNRQGAIAVAQILANPTNALSITEAYGMAPVIRAILDIPISDPTLQVIYNQALIARGWLDPDEEATSVIIQSMIEDVVSNRTKITDAVLQAVTKITQRF